MRTVRWRHEPCRAVCALLLAIPAVSVSAHTTYPVDYALQRFRLPRPEGEYAVGTRSLTIKVGRGTPLEVIVWYPTMGADGPPVRYFTEAERRIERPAILRNFRWPARLLDNLATEPTHAHEHARIVSGKFPAVIFSHGYWSYPRQNTALMEALASHGYVVFSLAHPGDAADLPTAHGVYATIPYDKTKAPDSRLLDSFWAGPTDAGRRAAFPGFWRALQGGRLLASLERWRTDILRLTSAVSRQGSAGLPTDVARAVDSRRVAFAGMSFGGSTSASACRREKRCRAVVNLDGFEFDRRLYNHRLHTPLLLIQSDWHLYPNSGHPNACFTAYDYAYRLWSGRGPSAPVYRFAVRGIRHMGLTDLILAPRDKVRDALLGTADGAEVVNAVNSTVLAFLDHSLKGRDIGVVAAAARHSVLERHVPLKKPIGCAGGAKR